MFEKQVNLEHLKEEQRKREAALQEVSDQVAAIEASERQKREEKERRERQLADFEERVEKCRGWIAFCERKIVELHEKAGAQAKTACGGGGGEFLMMTFRTSQEILGWERSLAIFKECEGGFESEIRKLSEANERAETPDDSS